MAHKASLLLSPVALCFILVLGVQGVEEIGAAVVFHGIVQCSNNPATVVNNATVQVVINGTTVVGTGQTTGTGRFMIIAEATSKEELMSLMNNSSVEVEVVSMAPPQACGASANAIVKLDETPMLQNILADLGLQRDSSKFTSANSLSVLMDAINEQLEIFQVQ